MTVKRVYDLDNEYLVSGLDTIKGEITLRGKV